MLTIITPTYNRGYIIQNAFKSLCAQTCKSFEWIIINDGSTDNTTQIVKSWMNQHLPFAIIYKEQQNGGKHRALNNAIKEANGNYILILDSDDYLTPNAVEKILQWCSTIDGDKTFAGIAGLKGWINKEGCVGQKNKCKYIDAKNTERHKYQLTGDKAEVYRTNILMAHPFPEFPGEKFLSEHIVWDEIANEGYKIRWFNEIIYKCEYLEDGLTKGGGNNLMENNFNGFTLSCKIKISYEPTLLKYFIIGMYTYVAKKKGFGTKYITEVLGTNRLSILIGSGIFYVNKIIKRISSIAKNI